MKKFKAVFTILFLGLIISFAPHHNCQADEPIAIQEQNIETQITGEQIWQALLNDPEKQNMSQEQKDIIKPYVLKTPEFLKEFINEQATFKTILQSHICISEFLLNNNYLKKTLGILPEENFSLGKEATIAMTEELLRMTIDSLKELVPKVDDLINSEEFSEELTLAKLKMNEENITKFKNGTLKISDILLSQPYILYFF